MKREELIALVEAVLLTARGPVRAEEIAEAVDDKETTDETIDAELWGWTGDKFSVPIWNGDPRNGGRAFQVKFRRSDDLERGYHIG